MKKSRLALVLAILMMATFGIAAMAPSVTYAAENNAPVFSQTNEAEETVASLWEKAEAQAQEDGEEIHELSVANSVSKTVPRRRAYRSSKASTSVFVAGQLEQIYEVASFNAVGSNPVRIGDVYGVYVAGFSGTVTNQVVKYTKIDSGRTLAVHMTFTVKNYASFSTTFETYAEFPATGGGWMRINAV